MMAEFITIAVGLPPKILVKSDTDASSCTLISPLQCRVATDIVTGYPQVSKLQNRRDEKMLVQINTRRHGL